jgi:hypothetical protein
MNNAYTNIHAVSSVRTEDSLLVTHSYPNGLARRKLFLDDEMLASFTLFAEPGSPLDLEIRANCAVKGEA